MAALDIATAKAYAARAGFSGHALDTIVAIAMGESGLRPDATNTAGNSAGVDRGIVQINSAYHPEVSDACAFDPECAFQQAYRISSSGARFTPWSVFNSGAYERHLPKVMSTSVGDVAGDVAGAAGDLVSGAGGLLGKATDLIGGAVGGAAGVVVDPVVNAVGKMFGGFVNDLARAGLAAVFVVAALGLIVAGVWQAVAPRVRAAADKAGQTAQEVAPYAAMLA